MYHELGRAIQQRRLSLKKEFGREFNQDVVAASAGITQKVLSDIETGDISYLPSRRVLKALASTLSLSYMNLLIVAGVVDQDDLQYSPEQTIRETDWEEIVRIKAPTIVEGSFIAHPELVVPTIETAIRGQMAIERISEYVLPQVAGENQPK